MENDIPSDEYLAVYDRRVADREAEMRRPARWFEVISNENHDRQNQIARLRTEWQGRYLDEVRRRNMTICYKVFLLLKEQYPAVGITESMHKEVAVAVCESVTKGFLLHCQMRGEEALYRPDAFQNFASVALGISVSEREMGKMVNLARKQESPTKTCSLQLKQDLEKVESFVPLATALKSVPGYSDPDTRRQLLFSVSMRFKGVRRDRQKPAEDFIKQNHQALEGSGPKHCIITSFTPEQKEALKLVFNNEENIRALEPFYEGTQWSKEPETLAQQKKMLSAIVNDGSMQRTLVGTMLKGYTEANMVVEAAASARNEAYGSNPLGSSREAGEKRYWDALHTNSERLRVPALNTDWVLLDGFEGHWHHVGPYLDSWINLGFI
ncbi:hypothetical protein PG997_011259 [Apiospora hydei]|uniref:Uncharacterized protein n=1 Tax=Apiospora hydei TaxID=1337664 RepID=A0ABR1VIJ2_9PEZI